MAHVRSSKHNHRMGRRLPTSVFMASAGVLSIVITTSAHAGGPIELEIAFKLGYASNDYGVGVGGRAGASFHGLYAGGNIANYFGCCGGLNSVPNAIAAGGEVGYGIRAPAERQLDFPMDDDCIAPSMR